MESNVHPPMTIPKTQTLLLNSQKVPPNLILPYYYH